MAKNLSLHAKQCCTYLGEAAHKLAKLLICIASPVCFLRILGTSGQPVDDVKRYTDIEDSLDILERMLEWGHIAPTAPDTLSEYSIVSGHNEYSIA